MRSVYEHELISLVRSILLKSTHQAEAINKFIVENYGINAVSTDYTTWRYYLNLNGEYHFTNEEMEIHVVETNTTHILTKELLAKYKKTRDELSRCQLDYKALIAKYPNNELLIKGMINPVDPVKAYNAKNGELLSYSTYYADINDVSVLRKLSKYTQAMYYRWFNPFYVNIEERQVAVFLAWLYSNLYTKIDLIRMENIHTHKVHSYHMECFFKSNLNIDTRYLNTKSKMWLYQNLRALMINNGQSEAFNQILDNVITPNEVGVGKVTIEKAKPRLENSSISIKPNFTTDNINQIIVTGLNEHYHIDGMTLSEITSMEVKNGYIHETQYMDMNELVERVKRKVDQNNEIDLDTKVIHLLGKEDRDILPFPRINMILDNLFYIGAKSKTEFDIRYIDPNNNVSYDITMSQAIRMLGYYLLKYCDLESEDITIGSKSIFANNDVDVYKVLIPDGSDFKYIKALEEIRPVMVDEYFNSIDIADFIDSGINYFITEWLTKSSLLNQVSIANMDVVNKHKCYDEFTLYIGDISTEINLSTYVGYDYLEAIKALILNIGNGRLVLDLNEVNTESIKTYVELLSKTTSYHIQIIGSSIVGNSLHTFDEGFGEFSGPVIVTMDGYNNGLERLDGELKDSLITKARGLRVSGNDYLLVSDLTPMNGLATDESTMIPIRYTLADITKDRGIISTIVSDNDFIRMSDLTPMNGLATDESTMIRKVSYVNINLEGDAYGAGETMKFELKKDEVRK